MAAATGRRATTAILDPARYRRRALAIGLLVVAAIDLLLLARGISGSLRTTFVLSGGTSVHLPVLALPSRLTCIVAGIVTAALGVLQLVRRSSENSSLVIGAGLALFGIAFLTWAGAGKSVDFVGLLATSLVEAVPLTLGALSGVVCERAGVINIAIEGQFLVAAFFAAVVSSATHDLWLGLVAGTLSGALMALVLAVFTITYRADQIIVGIVLDAFALGLTSFLLHSLLVPFQSQLNSSGVFRPIAIPVLDRTPVIGSVLFDQNVLVYLTILILIAVQIGLFQTRWGLRARAVGEHPRAADTVGIDVERVRYVNVLIGGLIAGVGGASFTVGATGQFSDNMTAGLGYIALAAMIFGRWRPLGAVVAAVLFGFTDSLQFTFSVLGVPIPSPILTMFPYLATIVAVAGLIGQVRPPAADGMPYVRE
ncbi:MAG: ABC transporter permease [Candidatus Dormiibacterota bacterium]